MGDAGERCGLSGSDGEEPMRNCADCGVPDRPEVDIDINCSCDAKSDEFHRPDCHRLRHSVRTFLRLIGRSGERGSNVETEKLWREGKWEKSGWMPILRDGKLFASKVLCSRCIDRFLERQANKADYQRKSAAVAPQNQYSQEAYWRSMCS